MSDSNDRWLYETGLCVRDDKINLDKFKRLYNLCKYRWSKKVKEAIKNCLKN